MDEKYNWQDNPLPVSEKPLARIVVVESVYYQILGEEPLQLSSRFTRPLTTEEQFYQRRVVIDDKWSSIDKGWVKEVSLIHVSNETGTRLRTKPSEEENEDMARRVIELSFDNKVRGGGMLVLPGESQKFFPAERCIPFIRCLHGSATCTITVFPK